MLVELCELPLEHAQGGPLNRDFGLEFPSAAPAAEDAWPRRVAFGLIELPLDVSAHLEECDPLLFEKSQT